MKCPLCNLEVTNILAHYKVHDYNIKTKEDFLRIYPEWTDSMQVDTRKIGKHICPICKKEYKFKNGLSVHIKKLHPELWDKLIQAKNTALQEKEKKSGQICSICNKTVFDLKQHVERKHGILWEKYCETYNHDISLTKIVDNEYRLRLSKNKKYFYNETERGKELKREQSIKWTGPKNIIYNSDILEKAINTRSKNGKIPNKSYRGIHCYYTLIDKYTRSFEELKFIIFLELNNISFIYEPSTVLKYYNKEKNFVSSYLPDFCINSKYYELKTESEYERCFNNIENTKYNEIINSFALSKKQFEITTINKFASAFNLMYDKNAIMEKIINEYKNGNILFTCKRNSTTIKKITNCDNLELAIGVSLYD